VAVATEEGLSVYVRPFIGILALALVGACNRQPAAASQTSTAPAATTPAAAPAASPAAQPVASQPAGAASGAQPAPGAPGAQPGQETAKPVPAVLPQVLAKIDGAPVGRDELENAVKEAEARAGRSVPPAERDSVYRGLLDRVILMRLLASEAKVRGITVTPQEVTERIGQIKQQFPSEAEFQKELTKRHTTMAQLEEDQRRDILNTKTIEAEVAPRAVVTPQELEEFYKSKPEQFKEQESVRASHILIGVAKAFCIGLGVSKLTLVVEFVIMGLVLVMRPYGLLGKPPAMARATGEAPPPLAPPRRWAVAAWLALFLLVPLLGDRYVTVLATDIACFALFAVSLHFIMGPAGMVSFGHAAYFGIGAYAGALLFKKAGLPMELALVLAPFVAGLFAVVYGWFCVRLSGVYLAMLTLAFAQISWSIVFQWDELTAGSNGLVGVWPSMWLSGKPAYYYLTLALCGAGVAFLWRALFSPFGYVLRAGRDSPLRAEAIGIDLRAFQWAAFVLAGTLAGLAGVVFAFSKGSISPSSISIAQSTDGLVMVLLGGVETLTGPVVGAAIFTWLRDEVARRTEFWRAVLGLVILAIVVLFPQGLVGGLKALVARGRPA